MLALAFAVAVVVSAILSGLETGLYTTSRLRIFLDAQAGMPAARRAQQLLADMPRLLAVLLVGLNVANYAASLLAQGMLVRAQVAHPEVVGTLLVTAALFVFAESVPKNAFLRGRETLLYPSLPLLYGTYRMLAWAVAPVTWFAGRLSQAQRRRRGAADAVQAEEVLQTGAAEGLMSPFQQRVARGVLAMRDQTAADLAQPLEQFGRARLGLPGVQLPPGSRDHRVLVLEAAGTGVVGWAPLASLFGPAGFRAPRRAQTRPVPVVSPATGLDRVLVTLDQSRAPFVLLTDGRVVDANGLRRRVMGMDEAEPVVPS